MAVVGAAALVHGATPAQGAPATNTAWQSGSFHVDRPNVVRRSNIILGSPNSTAQQSLPLGNGSLGVAEWAANGFTAQLNRSDTLPNRKSPGQVTIPGLSRITSAPNFAAHLDLYDGLLTESGSGMTAQIYVRADSAGGVGGTDMLVVDVTGADPNSAQTAQVGLWSGRSPTAAVSGGIGTLAETWTDNVTGGTGATYGSLAAVTAGGRSVVASVVDSRTVRVSFNPNTDGSFRVLIGAPTWTGGNAASTASTLFGSSATTASATLQAPHLTWWHNFWATTNLLKITSTDGSADYLENLRTFYLYQEAGLNRGTGNVPGTQAGVADMYSFNQDGHDWVPSDVWWWNARMQVSANMTSGAAALNSRFLNFYTTNLANIVSWTSSKVPGKTGACVPETMRFNGNGYYGDGSSTGNDSCDTTIAPSYNSQNITTGAEVGLAIWQQYLMTGDTSLLSAGYPLMKAAAQFLLSYATVGTDGKLHTVSNAHETQWHVNDPVTDVDAMKALFPAVQKAAQTLGLDAAFVTQLGTAISQTRDYPRTDASTHSQVLTSSSDAGGQDVLAWSAQPTATQHNGENLDLEATYPYGLIGDNAGTLTDLEKRTYNSRVFRNNADWDYDTLYAARLGLASEVQSGLVATTEKYQLLISGMANLFGSGTSTEPYNEQTGIVAATLNDALVQDYDGLLRVAPAWPSAWDVDGTVSVQHNSKVDVQMRNGVPSTVVLEAGASAAMSVRSPWQGQSVQVIDANTSTAVVAPTTAATFTINTTSGHNYLIEQASSPFTNLPFAQVTGSPATAAKHLGPVSIGTNGTTTYASLAASFNNTGISSDTNTNPGNWDGGGASFSQQALAAAGATSGGTVSHAGLTFTWPSTAGSGSADNTIASGQTITMSGTGTLGFLVSADYGPASGTGTVHYTDGSTSSFTLGSPDWFASTAPAGTDVALSSAYQNRAGNTRYNGGAYVFYVPVTLTAGKTMSSVTLPNIAPSPVVSGTPTLHVFAMATHSGGSSVTFEGESFTSNSGVQTAAHTPASGGATAGFIENGDWLGYSTHSTAGVTGFSARIASAGSGGTIQIRSGSSTGTLLGSVTVPVTGNWETYQSVSTTLSASASGPLFLTFVGGSGYLFDVDSVTLTS
jgi:hypothetical protein